MASAIALNLNLTRLNDSRALVSRTTTILERTAMLQSRIRTAEAGQRGYILTGERRYLQPYLEASAQVWPLFAELRGLVLRQDLSQRLADLERPIRAKLDELAQTVSLRERGFEDALSVVRTDVGQRLMEEIEEGLQAFSEAERRLLEERSQDEARAANSITFVVEVTGLSALLTATLGIVLIARDRSRARVLAAEQGFRQELEQRVEQRTAELSEVNRELDAFAYTISHDLRAPLRAMHGYADSLEEDFGPELPPQARGYTHRITAAALRMEELIEDLLSYSRLTRVEMTLGRVDLEAVVRRTLDGLRPALDGAGARVEVAGPMPLVRANATLLGQVIENLVTNAAKFTAPGRGPVVRIEVETVEDRVRLAVRDEGIGIEPGHQERIFRPFERLHGTEAYPGTGIGLAIVRRAMERMEGRYGVTSVPGQGSRFFIELPAYAEPSRPGAPSAAGGAS
ncbi:MAG TPA: CHASE3 domain-containing protein [Microvirga sp.]